jgi:hypothetical protein
LVKKITRTPTRATGGVTPEEQVRLQEHAELWKARVLRTTPIEPDKIVPAIEGLYEVARLERPRVVVVPSPLAMAFAYGAASAIMADPESIMFEPGVYEVRRQREYVPEGFRRVED